MLNAHVVYTDINHVTAILLAVWARFDFKVGRADSELSFILNNLPAHKAEHLCAVQLEKPHIGLACWLHAVHGKRRQSGLYICTWHLAGAVG